MAVYTDRELALLAVPDNAKATITFLDGLSIFFGKAVSWLIIPMMFSLVYEVSMRYMFNSPSIWSMDMALILYGINFMVGSPYCLQQGQHIRTDFLYNRWSVKTKAVVDIITYLVLFFPAHIIFFDIGCGYFWKSFQQNESMVTSPWMPIVWPLKFAIPLCVGLTMLQGVSEVLKSYYRFKTSENLWPTDEHSLPENIIER